MAIDEAMEREYNNRAKVSNFSVILQEWGRDSAAFRAGHRHAELDLAYGPAPRQTIDIFWPGASRDAPLAIFLHGGYWQALDGGWFSHLAAGLNARGVAMALPSHQLCPEISLAALVEQAREAAIFLYRRHARPMLACGHSAGGHLAAMLMATDWPRHPSGGPDALARDLVMAGLTISGLFDLAPLLGTSINAALGLDLREALRLSPVRMAAPGLPLHAVVGGLEGPEYARQSRAIAEAWSGSSAIIEGADHFSILAGMTRSDSDIVNKILELM